MKHLIVISGHSGSGKDYLAKKLWPSVTNLKLNAEFKRLFELDHSLQPGSCNDRELRDTVLEHGPCQGLTIQAAMVQCYTESLSPKEKTYGATFAGRTMLKTLQTLLEDPASYIITDLRKPSEATVLKEFAVTQLGYSLHVYKIETNRGQVLDSDKHQAEVLEILGPYSLIYNYN
jgi:hypothetical protein